MSTFIPISNTSTSRFSGIPRQSRTTPKNAAGRSSYTPSGDTRGLIAIPSPSQYRLSGGRAPNRQSRAVQLHDPGVSNIPSVNRVLNTGSTSSRKVVQPPRSPLPRAALPARGISISPSLASTTMILPRPTAQPLPGMSSRSTRKGISPRPGDLVLLSNSPRSGTRVSKLPVPVPSNRSSGLQSSNDPRAMGPRSTPFLSGVIGPGNPLSLPGRRLTIKRVNGTVRGPRPKSLSRNSSDSNYSEGTLSRKGALSRMSRMSKISSSRSSISPQEDQAILPAHTYARVQTIQRLSCPDEVDRTSPELTMVRLPGLPVVNDVVSEPRSKTEVGLRRDLDTTPGESGGRGVVPKIPTGTDDLEAHIPMKWPKQKDGRRSDRPSIHAGPGIPAIPIATAPIMSRQASSVSAQSDGSEFSITIYLESTPQSDQSPSTSPEADLELLTISPMPPRPADSPDLPAFAMFDMKAPLVTANNGKTPYNTPIIEKDTIKRASRVLRQRDGLPELQVEYLGGKGMLVRDESVRSIVSRVYAITRKAMGGTMVHISKERESYRLDEQIMDALHVLADSRGSTDDESPLCGSISPQESLYALEYTGSPPAPVTWNTLRKLPCTDNASFAAKLAENHKSPESRGLNIPPTNPKYTSESHALQTKYQASVQDFGVEAPPEYRPIYTSQMCNSPTSLREGSPQPDDQSSTGLGLGLALRNETIYGLPSMKGSRSPARAGATLLYPSKTSASDSSLPFESPLSPIQQMFFDLVTGQIKHEEPPWIGGGDAFDIWKGKMDEIQTMRIKDLDTQEVVKLHWDSDEAVLREEGKVDKDNAAKAWWPKKLFRK